MSEALEETALVELEELLLHGYFIEAASRSLALVRQDNSRRRALFVCLQAHAFAGRLEELRGVLDKELGGLPALPLHGILLLASLLLETAQPSLARSDVQTWMASRAAGADVLTAQEVLVMGRLTAVHIIAEGLGDLPGAKAWLESGECFVPPEQRSVIVQELDDLEAAQGRAAGAQQQGLLEGPRRPPAAAVSGAEAATSSAEAAAGAAALRRSAESNFCTMTGDLGEEGEPWDGASFQGSAAASGDIWEQQQQPHDQGTPSSSSGGGAPSPSSNAWSAAALGSSLAHWGRQQLDAAGNAVRSVWQSRAVSTTLQACHLESLTPAQAVVGSAAGALLVYALYKERKPIAASVKQRLAQLQAGLLSAQQTLAMGVAMNTNAAATLHMHQQNIMAPRRYY